MTQLPALIETHGPALPTLTVADLLEAFLSSLSPRTRRAYDGDVRDFARFLGVPSPRDAVELFLGRGPSEANRAALAYRSDMSGRRHLAPATIARRLSALRSLVELGATIGGIAWSLKVRSPKVEAYRDTTGPGHDGWRRMVEAARSRQACTADDPRAARDLAIGRLLHDLMLRRAEVTGLDLEHVELADGAPAAVWILGKGRSSRERMELPPVTSAALEAWLAIRGRGPGPLFCPVGARWGHAGELRRLSDWSVWHSIREMGEDAALSRSVHPHGLRHEGITRAIETGAGLMDTQRAARHADPRTTQRYIDRYNDPSAAIHRRISED